VTSSACNPEASHEYSIHKKKCKIRRKSFTTTLTSPYHCNQRSKHPHGIANDPAVACLLQHWTNTTPPTHTFHQSSTMPSQTSSSGSSGSSGQGYSVASSGTNSQVCFGSSSRAVISIRANISDILMFVDVSVVATLRCSLLSQGRH
jgi:hypothetical protein